MNWNENQAVPAYHEISIGKMIPTTRLDLLSFLFSQNRSIHNFCETIFGRLTRNIQIYDTAEKYVYLNFFIAF